MAKPKKLKSLKISNARHERLRKVAKWKKQTIEVVAGDALDEGLDILTAQGK